MKVNFELMEEKKGTESVFCVWWMSVISQESWRKKYINITTNFIKIFWVWESVNLMVADMFSKILVFTWKLEFFLEKKYW